MHILHHPESDSTFAVNQTLDADFENGVYVVNPWELRAGTKIDVGYSHTVVIPDFDFETYSEAGYEFIPGIGRSKLGQWKKIEGVSSTASNPLMAVGTPAYAEHPSTELLSLAYNLKDGLGPRLWVPGMPPPYELFDYLAGGGLLEAHNSGFEYLIWNYHCVRVLGWPPLSHLQLRCSMAKARHYSLMGGLEDLGRILEIPTQKQAAEGKRLLKKFAGPRNPTKDDGRLRVRAEEEPEEAAALYDYNVHDTYAESGVSAGVPDMPEDELQLWLLDQKINFTGVHIDIPSAESCKSIIKQALVKGNAEVLSLTGGAVKTVGQHGEIRAKLAEWGVDLANMKKETVAKHWKHWDVLHPTAPPEAKRLMQLRALLGSASVKKVFALTVKTNRDSRYRELFAFYGAHPGRWSGRGVQPQNLPNSGPKVRHCSDASCGRHYDKSRDVCPWCGAGEMFSEVVDWNVAAVDDALAVMNHNSDLSYLEHIFGDAVPVIAGCLRGLFVSAPGHDLLCSDYSAIEAVVLACIAGEQWRVNVFNDHGKIYEASAAQASGLPLEVILQHKKDTGDHHPLRKLGKVRELAGGYQGGPGAWKNFGADMFMSEPEIIEDVKKWRKGSPNIVDFWYDLQRAAHNAVKYPGRYFSVQGLTYCVKDDVLYLRLLSGRFLKYHKPSLVPDDRRRGSKLCYWGRNSETNKWTMLDTYGGKLCENIVQATARDIMAHAMINLDRAGYNIVLHVHDEIICEVPEGSGSITELERIMATLPEWCSAWPIRAAGGWRGKRYRKD